ncbi:MAG: class B sortase [Clostridia bacterium]|nr:class B sortase [Clostridia bacterium]
MRSKHSEGKNLKFSHFILWLFRLVCIGIMCYSGFKIYTWHKENVENDKLKNSFQNTITEEKVIVDGRNAYKLNIDFEELLKRNSETVGWIKVNNTNIDYPIVRHNDNEYYLTHNFENSYNSSGWIFLDYRNNSEILDKNTIIYGHNRLNDSMFGTLKNALDSSWCDNYENRYISFSTTTNNYVAQIFSIYKIDVNTLSVPNNFKDNEDYNKYLEDITSKSYYNFETTVDTSNNILTLYTCGDNSNYRVIVHAKILDI